jgi:telomere length regulation protein
MFEGTKLGLYWYVSVLVIWIHSDSIDRIITSLFDTLIDLGSIERFTNLLSQMKTFEQRKYLNAIAVFVVKEYFFTDTFSKDDRPIAASSTVSSAAALFHTLIEDDDVLKEHLVSSLTRSTIPALDESLLARRSVLAALAKDEGQSGTYTCGDLELTTCREIT